jgi:hypothetical protein
MQKWTEHLDSIPGEVIKSILVTVHTDENTLQTLDYSWKKLMPNSSNAFLS